ncbi:hypothetical protein J3E69DRAFT_348077 [Trichoderma sp. SZMC 28015]
MDWTSRQNLNFMSFLGYYFYWELLTDPTLFGDNFMNEPLAAPESHSSSMPNFPDAAECMGDGNDIFSPQFDPNLSLSTSNTSQCEAIGPSFEDHSALDTTTTPSAGSSSNPALSPTDIFPSVSPPAFFNYQLLGMSYQNEGQPESLGGYMPITPMNPPRNPTNVQKPRGRKRKNLEMLKRDERKLCRPEKCHICGFGHAQRRELERHMVSNHRKEAERMKLDVSKVSCRFCGLGFDSIRRDRLHRHMKRKHPNSL